MKMIWVMLLAPLIAVASEKYEDKQYQTEAIRLEPEIKDTFGRLDRMKIEPSSAPKIAPSQGMTLMPDQVAQKYYQSGITKPENRPYVFISNSLPEQTLEKLFQQASKSGSILVLRGVLNSSYMETVKRFQPLQAKYPAMMQIDPTAFRRYDIRSVPAFVVNRVTNGTNSKALCNQDSCSKDKFAVLMGDVTLEFALEKIGNQSQEYEKEVTPYLNKIKGQP